MMEVFLCNQGHSITHKRLLEKIWGDEKQVQTNVVWMYISYLRRNLVSTPRKSSDYRGKSRRIYFGGGRMIRKLRIKFIGDFHDINDHCIISDSWIDQFAELPGDES